MRNRACGIDRSLEYDEKRSVSRDSPNLYVEPTWRNIGVAKYAQIFRRATSDSVQKAIWMLGETGQLFDHVELGGRFGGLDDFYFLQLNPHGRVPRLCDGDVVA